MIRSSRVGGGDPPPLLVRYFFSMKALKRINATYDLKKLPRLKSRRVKHGEKICYTGSIVRRRIIGPVKIYWHYAFLYGVDTKGRILLIENNQDGVECITWEDFKLGQKWEMHYVESTPKRFAQIMKRARQRALIPYNGAENNCEHFINYCVFGRTESKQTDNTKQVADVFLSYFEIRLLNTPNSEMILESMQKMRESMKVPRTIPDIGAKLEKKITETVKAYQQKRKP